MDKVDDAIAYLQKMFYEEYYIKHTPYAYLRVLESQINALLRCKAMAELSKPLTITIPMKDWGGFI